MLECVWPFNTVRAKQVCSLPIPPHRVVVVPSLKITELIKKFATSICPTTHKFILCVGIFEDTSSFPVQPHFCFWSSWYVQTADKGLLAHTQFHSLTQTHTHTHTQDLLGHNLMDSITNCFCFLFSLGWNGAFRQTSLLVFTLIHLLSLA